MASRENKVVTIILPGGWMPSDPKIIRKFVADLKKYVKENPTPLVPPIEDLKTMVESNPLMLSQWELMFQRQEPGDGKPPEVESFGEFLTLLNALMTRAPEYTAIITPEGPKPIDPVAVPINTLLNWPMATAWGYEVFSNQIINQQFKRILNYWCNFLVTSGSRYVLQTPANEVTAGKKEVVYKWLSDVARKELVAVATAADTSGEFKDKPFDYFYKCDPNKDYYGFNSWDDFFTRKFNVGVRPVASGSFDVANACEAAPLQHISNVKLTDKFWVKAQPYSIENMMDFDPLAQHFEGGTVYQGFLSPLTYHRWHSPVTGTVVKAFLVNGSYYLANREQPDEPNAQIIGAQAFLTSVASRAVIFLRSDNPTIDLICVVAVGMIEVSSCELRVQDGQRINKGDELGMFHFGGSSHCVVFRRGLDFEWHFDRYNTTPGPTATNIPINASLCTVSRSQ